MAMSENLGLKWQEKFISLTQSLRSVFDKGQPEQ